jgi:hypothetical protein
VHLRDLFFTCEKSRRGGELGRIVLGEEEVIAWVLACMESLSWRLGHHLV